MQTLIGKLTARFALQQLRFGQSFLVFFFHFILLATFTQATPAQSGSVLSGNVTDQSKAAVPGAVVKAVNLASGSETTATANEAGLYQLNNLAVGLYRVTASKDGFTVATVNLTLRENAKQDFELAPGTLADTVTVTAGKGAARAAEDTPQTVSVVTSDNLEERRPAAVMQAIERTPNLNSTSANAFQDRPRLRGLDASRVLIVVDGERLNNVRHNALIGAVSPATVDITQLESVEVLGSAGSSLFGSDAMAGTINLVTKAPTRPDSGQILGVRFDGDYRTNENFHRYGAAINWSNRFAAVRLSGSLFRAASYKSGNQAINAADVIALGNFANTLGSAVGNAVPRTFPVFNLAANAEIFNSQAHGGNDQIDLWLFPSDKHSLRYRQLNSQHYNIGTPAILNVGGQSSNSFRRLDKYGGRYEGREFNSWLARVAGGGYWQKFVLPQDAITSPIVTGSSFRNITGGSELTGNLSTFSLSNNTQNKSEVTSIGFDGQATLIPLSRLLVTTGVAYLRDASSDQFARFNYGPTGPTAFSAGAGNPNTRYRNVGWFTLAEYEPIKWLRVTGGYRVDNWKTAAFPTKGFPLGLESTIFNSTIAAVRANPGAVNVAGLDGVADLVAGTKGIETNETVVTGNVGVVARLPFGINPYFRWANSFRVPEVTTRFILRNFGAPNFSVLNAPNLLLKPERGNNYDVGVKVRRTRWTASFGYFRNNLTDFIRSVNSPTLTIPANPAAGILPTFGNTHQFQYFQSANTAQARIQGVEASYEVSLPLGAAGSLTPFGTLGWLKGTDLTPQANAVTVVSRFYNGSTPVKLSGATDDVPLPNITPFRGVFGAAYADKKGAWFGEYQARYQARVTRVDPIAISSTNTTSYTSFASLEPFTRQTLRGGYNLRREAYRMTFSVSVENLTDRFYFEHFTSAPAMGRTVVFGITTDFFNLLRR